MDYGVVYSALVFDPLPLGIQHHLQPPPHVAARVGDPRGPAAHPLPLGAHVGKEGLPLPGGLALPSGHDLTPQIFNGVHV